MNKYSEKILFELHKKLNRLDVDKDAFKCNEKILNNLGSNLLFKNVADNLFGTLKSFDGDKKILTEKIDKYKGSVKTIPLEHLLVLQDFIPKKYKKYIHDCGTGINADTTLELIITPGSYIDTASKTKNGIYYGFDKILTVDDFLEIGIEYIYELSCKLNKNKSCKVNIKLSFDNDINVSFNDNFKPIPSNNNSISMHYFEGNATKNNWINLHGIDDIKNIFVINEIKKLIITKLIGDSLQAYYCKLYLDSIPYNAEKDCILTTADKFLYLRSILLNIPIILFESKPIEKMTLNTPENIDDVFCKFYYDRVINHNNKVIENINTVIAKNYLIINNSKVIINTAIIEYLNLIINELNIRNNEVGKIRSDSTDKYRQALFKNKGQHIINVIDDEHILYDNIYYLFPLMKLETDVIFTKNMSLNEYLLSLIKTTGGNKINEKDYYDLPIYKVIPDNYEEYIEQISIKDHANYIKYAFYYNLKKINTNTENQNKRDAENLYNLIFHYYNFTGCTIKKTSFISIIIEEYNRNHLKHMTLDNYIALFKSWYNEIKTEDDDDFENVFHYYNDTPKNTRTRKRVRNNRLNNTRKIKTVSAK
jgi:hypothetical protein